jgi:hypothetical protein
MDIVELVGTSFLTPTQKQHLTALVAAHGPTQDFYTKFNNALIADTELRSEKDQHISDQIQIIETELATKLAALETELTNNLAEAPQTATQTWDTYYAQKDKAYGLAGQQIQASLSAFLVQNI